MLYLLVFSQETSQNKTSQAYQELTVQWIFTSLFGEIGESFQIQCLHQNTSEDVGIQGALETHSLSDLIYVGM